MVTNELKISNKVDSSSNKNTIRKRKLLSKRFRFSVMIDETLFNTNIKKKKDKNKLYKKAVKKKSSTFL